MEVESEGGIVFAGIDEIEHIVIILNETFNEEGGSEEGVGVEVAGVHVYEEDELRESWLAWLRVQTVV